MRARLLLLAAATALLPACASHELDLQALASASDEIVWEAGQKAMQKKSWDAARQYFKRLIDAFPQSQHQPDARIALGDAYFDEGGTGNYILAVSAYREFLTLYPQHPRADYAQFRAGECYFKQMNSSDRDQTATHQALDEYQRLLDIYPQSQYVEAARERIKECRERLAKANFQVGYFYQRTRQAWRSAIGRYEIIINDFPDYSGVDEVLYRLAECLAAAGRYAEARPQIARLQRDFPDSPFVDDARKLEAGFPESAAPAPPPPAAPAGPASPPPTGPPPTR